jgi:hypothetical protein
MNRDKWSRETGRALGELHESARHLKPRTGGGARGEKRRPGRCYRAADVAWPIILTGLLASSKKGAALAG